MHNELFSITPPQAYWHKAATPCSLVYKFAVWWKGSWVSLIGSWEIPYMATSWCWHLARNSARDDSQGLLSLSMWVSLHSMGVGYKVKVSGDSPGNWHNFPSTVYCWFVNTALISGRGIHYFSMTGVTKNFGATFSLLATDNLHSSPMSYISILFKKSQRFHLITASGTRSRNKISSSKSRLAVDKAP